jgi:hypothetical protein
VSVESPPQPPLQPEPPARDAKAELKAAKAYAKAQRSWYQKKRFVLPLGAFLLIMVISVAASGGGTDSTTTAPHAVSPVPAAKQPSNQPNEVAAPAAANGPTAKLPIQNGDWRLDSIRVKDDGLGDFGGTTRVTYTGDNPEGGTNLFTITVFVGGKDIAVLNGSVSSVQPGRTATVQLISQDKFVGGPYKFDFQNDL